jgi:hypothetical protein
MESGRNQVGIGGAEIGTKSGRNQVRIGWGGGNSGEIPKMGAIEKVLRTRIYTLLMFVCLFKLNYATLL